MKRVSPDLATLCALWRIDPDHLVHVRDGANSVYELSAFGSRFFLRATTESHRSRDQIEAELDFVRFVASQSISVAMPQPSARGELVETVRRVGLPPLHAVVFSAVPGRNFRFSSGDIGPALFHAWGRAMGALHLASRDFVPPASSRRHNWTEQFETSCCVRRIPETELDAIREYHRIAEWLESVPTNQNWGLIHGDFERTNFAIDEHVLWLYDFDDACYHWYVADVAHALWAFRNAPIDDRARFLAWFLEGYRERGCIEVDVYEHLSWFVRLRTLSLFVNRLHRPSADAWIRRTRPTLAKPAIW